MPNLNDIMEMMNALETKAIITAPTRCVAVRNRHSSCRKCADVCLADCITIDKNELEIDAGACVACGACVAVCPTQALISVDPMEEELAAAVADTTRATDGVTVIACARKAARQTGDPDKYSVVPCLARMDEMLLVELAARGIRDIHLVDGTCRTCKYRAAVPAIDDTVASARELLATVGSDAVITRSDDFPPEAKVADLHKAVGAARREFFTSTGHYAKDVAKSAAEKVVNDKLRQLKLQKEEQSLREKLGGKELTIEELLTQPFFLTEQDNYRRVLNRRLAARRTILTPSLECGDTSLLIRMLEIDRGVSFLPWYAVENSVKEGRLIRLSVEDCYISLYRQIFSHKEKWRTREMDEFVRVAKLADEEE